MIYRPKRYQRTKYGNSTERMQKFVTLMSAYGSAVGIDFNGFEGTIAGTLDAHRLIQFAQEGHGPEVADKVVNCNGLSLSLSVLFPVCHHSEPFFFLFSPLFFRATLHEHPYQKDFITLTYSQHYVALYESYHTKSLHPSAPSTLLTAAQSASASGLADEMEFFVSPQIDPAVFLRETKALLREQLSNGVDGVPLVVVEGRKRDFTLLGGREVGEYLEVLQKVAGEK